MCSYTEFLSQPCHSQNNYLLPPPVELGVETQMPLLMLTIMIFLEVDVVGVPLVVPAEVVEVRNFTVTVEVTK